MYVRERLPGRDCPATRESGPPPMDVIDLASTGADIQVHLDRVRDETCGPPPEAVVVCRVAGSGSQGSTNLVASPGQKIDCDSNRSRARTGNILDRGWQLDPAPGSTTKLTVGPRSLGVTFVPDAWGTYRVGVEVSDQAKAGSAFALVEAPPPPAGVLPIELHWMKIARSDDASMYPRVELHVAEVAASASGAAAQGEDCSATTAKTWCDVHVTGTVQRAIVRPEPGKTYRAYVVYDDFRLKGAPMACVRTFPIGRPPPKGAQPLSARVCDDTLRSAASTWDLGPLDPTTRTFTTH